MNIYSWFLIFNLNDFLATELVSKDYALNLETVGQSVFTAFQGNVVSIKYLDEFMPVNMYPEPMYEKLNYAVYRDDETGNVWFGFLVEDEN